MQIKVHGIKSLVCGTYVDEHNVTHEVEIAVVPEVAMATWGDLKTSARTGEEVTFEPARPTDVIVDRFQTLGDYGYNND